MKNLIQTKYILALVFGMVLLSCDQDDSIPNTPLANTTLAEVVEDNITVTEGSDVTFTILQQNLIEGKSDFWEGSYVYDDPISGQLGMRITGGTATEGEDFVLNNYDWDNDTGNYNFMFIQDFSPFLLQDGYIYNYDATTSLQNLITDFITIIDDGISEGAETIEFQLYPVALGFIIIDDSFTITIND
ncbi:hypothetical protein [Litoribaculum gwangyangense]